MFLYMYTYIHICIYICLHIQSSVGDEVTAVSKCLGTRPLGQPPPSPPLHTLHRLQLKGGLC